MGYTTRNNSVGGKIKSFWPDDTETTMYIAGLTSMFHIMSLAKLKWPHCYDYSNITIESEKIQTECLGYDLYDDGDYTNFIVVTLKE